MTPHDKVRTKELLDQLHVVVRDGILEPDTNPASVLFALMQAYEAVRWSVLTQLGKKVDEAEVQKVARELDQEQVHARYFVAAARMNVTH